MGRVWNAYTDRLERRLKRPVGPTRPGMKTQRGVVLVTLLSFAGIILVAIGLGRAAPEGTSGAAVGVTAYLVFLAAAAVGTGLGFLFGLPRSRFTDAVAQEDVKAAAAGETGSQPRSKHYLNNSNLIKVSDWLTTIVVGLTLVNLESVVPAVRDLGAALSAPLGGQTYSAVVGVSLTIYGVLAGFILSFLWVSIRVRELMEDAERWAETEVVPGFTGRTVREAIASAGEVQLRLDVPAGAAVDQIVSGQQPVEGTPARPGSAVQLTVV